MNIHDRIMIYWTFIMLTLLNLVSILVFFLINRETKRVIDGHIELIRKVNAALVETRTLKIARFCYFFVLFFLVLFSYLLFYFWSQ